jgi:hypothetical protein
MYAAEFWGGEIARQVSALLGNGDLQHRTAFRPTIGSSLGRKDVGSGE